MNKMYEYLKNHAYVSYNKKSTYEFELSEERAECIANKYDILTYELQKENKQLKDNWNKLKEWLKEYEEGTYGLGSYETGLSDGLGDVIKKMQELEGSNSNE